VVANNLRQIDRSLFTTVKILVLDISLNHITSLPDTLTYPHQAHMTKLTAISNQITFIPAGALTGMKWLSAINLMENSITRIEPNSFQRLEILKELNLIGNPLQTVPSNVFQDMKGTDIYLHCDRISPMPVLSKNVMVRCVPDAYSVPMTVGCGTGALLLRNGFACQFTYSREHDSCTCNRCPNGTMSSGLSLLSERGREDSGCRPCPAGIRTSLFAIH
jgi:Leucine-rich repeat (LRR) protein